MLTRNLLGMAANRICTESVTLIYAEAVDNDDGSATVTDVSMLSMASVTALQHKDIQRLQFAGLKVKDGVTIVLPFGTKQPDRIAHGVHEYRIVSYASDHGATVCMCDKISLAAAVAK